MADDDGASGKLDQASSGPPTDPGRPPANVQGLMLAYEHCAADVRNFDAMLWQIPSFAAAALYAIVYAKRETSLPPYLTAIALFAGLMLISALALALRKNRYFQEARVCSLRDVVAELRAHNVTVYEVPITGAELRRKADAERSAQAQRRGYTELVYGPSKPKPFVQLSAFVWLQRAMLILVGAAFALFVVSIYDLLRHIWPSSTLLGS